MPESIRKLKTITKLLPCKLTEIELLNYGNELALTVQNIGTEEERQASLKQELKARLTALESKRSEIASKVARKEEYRDVEVEPMLDFLTEHYKEIRTDTGELVYERPINEHERQEQMDLAETDK